MIIFEGNGSVVLAQNCAQMTQVYANTLKQQSRNYNSFSCQLRVATLTGFGEGPEFN